MRTEDFLKTSLKETEKYSLSTFKFKDDSQFGFIYGRHLHFRGVDSVDKRRAKVLFLHDLGEHSGRYTEKFIEFFALIEEKHNSAPDITFFDYRGHGKSHGTRGHIQSVDQICKDAIELLNTGEEDERPVCIMAVGLGALIALKLIHVYFKEVKRPITQLMLFNPALKLRWNLPGPLEGLAKMGGMPFAKIKLPFSIRGEQFCGDNRFGEVFDQDPLINHSLTWASLVEIQKNATLIRTSGYYLDIPVFVATSGHSPFYDPKVTELFAKGIERSTFHHYASSFHDLFHNFQYEKFESDVYNWLKQTEVI